MKTITTKIPNKEKKCHYALIHVDTFTSLIKYIEEVNQWEDLDDWKNEITNELEAIRRI